MHGATKSSSARQGQTCAWWTSHAFTWRVVQGADTNAHAYVANVVWSPAGTEMRGTSSRVLVRGKAKMG